MEKLEQVILLRYGEIYLKGKNRGMFENVLQNNIKAALSDLNCTFARISGRYVVSGYDKKDQRKVITKLTKVPGLHSLSPAYVIASDYDEIKKLAVSLMDGQCGTFKVQTNRADKTFLLSSMELSADLGGVILDSNADLVVDVKTPKIVLSVDIRENGKTYMFFETVKCAGGMPVSTAGKGLLLLSGGIDSPVAGFMMIKRGVKISALHFESFPYTSMQAKEKVLDLAKILKDYNAGSIDVYVARMTHIQDEIHSHCDPDYMITLVRRFMLRIAESVAKQNNLACLITGESLAQVASQTMESITTISSAISGELPFFRPLIGFDKQETVEIAQRIDTYETSIKPYDDCCTVFLPDSPVTRPKLYRVLREEARIDVKGLVEEALSKIEVIKI